eukprot:UN24018
MQEYLKSETIKDWKECQQKPHVLDKGLLIDRGVEKLLDWKIRTAPVFDAKTGQAVGVFDLRDVVKYVTSLEERKAKEADLKKWVGKERTIEELKKKTPLEVFCAHPSVKSQKVDYLAKIRHFVTVKNTSTCLECVKALSGKHHLIGVVDDKATVVRFLTQKMLFARICDKFCEIMCEDKFEHIKELGSMTSPVTSVRDTATCLEAFRILSQREYGAIAVVNAQSKLIHETSGRDVKLWLQ